VASTTPMIHHDHLLGQRREQANFGYREVQIPSSSPGRLPAESALSIAAFFLGALWRSDLWQAVVIPCAEANSVFSSLFILPFSISVSHGSGVDTVRASCRPYGNSIKFLFLPRGLRPEALKNMPPPGPANRTCRHLGFLKPRAVLIRFS